MAKRTPGTLAARFWAKVNKSGPVPSHRPELGPCWVWTASLDTGGYGQIGVVGLRRPGRASRVSWQLHYGAVPDGLWVLHRCDNPPCVRPEHLFLGTVGDNVRDMISKGRRVDASSAKTHCPQGHPYDEANTYRNPTTGKRACRICGRAAQERYLAPRRSPRVPKTQCVNGHPFDEENTRWTRGRKGKPRRECRECGNAAARRYKQRKAPR